MDLSNRSCNFPKLSQQKGAALILLVFMLTLVVLAYTVKTLNSNDVQAQQNEKTLTTLSDAKSALIAWAINNSNRPGLMPYPDRSSGDNNYDGKSDCYTTTTLDGNYDKLLGKLPWLAADDANCTNLISGIGQEFKDSSGEHLWYAVSRNLVYDYKNSTYPTINPGIISNPTYPWMKVLDKNGNTISSRVAAMIIAPGAPNADQDRSASTPAPTEYLDKFYIGGSLYSNTGYSQPDEDWVIGEDARGVSSSNTTYQQPYYFNDKLVYITIDELMEEVEKRATGEARKALQNYYTSNGYYPHPAKLGAVLNYSCDSSSTYGLLPVNNTATSCSCTWGSTRKCTCGFDVVSTISYKRSGAQSWTGKTNNCSYSGKTCTCTGAGTCTRSAQTFLCTGGSSNYCTAGASGTYTFTGTFNYSGSHTTCGKVSGCNAATCTVAGATTVSATTTTFGFSTCGDAAFNNAATNSALPTWFTTNNWQDYIYYQVSSSCINGSITCATATPQITVGSKTGVRSLLISAGPILSSQTSRTASCSINDYLDSAENTNNDTIFDAVNTPRKSTYNDQMFIVAP